jgi:hypothetical protein
MNRKRADLRSKIPAHNQEGGDQQGRWWDRDRLEVVQTDHDHDCRLSGHGHELVQELYLVDEGSHTNEEQPTNGHVDNYS